MVDEHPGFAEAAIGHFGHARACLVDAEDPAVLVLEMRDRR